MSGTIKLSEVVQQEFRTSESASKKNENLAKILGTPRYGPARLSLSLSLADKRPVKAEMTSDTKGNSVRGRNLFGDDADMVAWIALITQHAGQDLDKQAFIAEVAAHWERGIGILSKIWEGAGGDFDKFITALAEKSGMPTGLPSRTAAAKPPPHPPSPGPIDLHIGKLMGAKKEPLVWRINARSQAPHIAVMGATGTGKTRLALNFAESLHEQSKCPVFVFDIKGDISRNTDFCAKIGAKVIGIPIPLDILHIADKNNKAAVRNAADSLSHSIRFVTQGAARGAVQMGRLRKVAARVFAESDNVSIALLHEAYCEEHGKEDSVSVALDQLCGLELFTHDHSPEQFFSRSWIFDLHKADPGIQEFSAVMILDSFRRCFDQRDEADVDRDHNRQITALLVVDEAHRILGSQHPALTNILRLIRSKGGVVILSSQSPRDYRNEDTNFLENIGLVASYRTHATPGEVRKVFSTNVQVVDLSDGVCVVRLPGKPVQKVRVFE